MNELNENEILEFLKNMKFKYSLFGVSKKDVLIKMRTLNNMYKKVIPDAGFDEQAGYHEKVEAVAKAFVDVQEQSNGILAKANKEAETIIANAQLKAQELETDLQDKLAIAKFKADEIMADAEAGAADIDAENQKQLDLAHMAVDKIMADIKVKSENAELEIQHQLDLAKAQAAEIIAEAQVKADNLDIENKQQIDLAGVRAAEILETAQQTADEIDIENQKQIALASAKSEEITEEAQKRAALLLTENRRMIDFELQQKREELNRLIMEQNDLENRLTEVREHLEKLIPSKPAPPSTSNVTDFALRSAANAGSQKSGAVGD